jgi:hypothetical protein
MACPSPCPPLQVLSLLDAVRARDVEIARLTAALEGAGREVQAAQEAAASRARDDWDQGRVAMQRLAGQLDAEREAANELRWGLRAGLFVLGEKGGGCDSWAAALAPWGLRVVGVHGVPLGCT